MVLIYPLIALSRRSKHRPLSERALRVSTATLRVSSHRVRASDVRRAYKNLFSTISIVPIHIARMRSAYDVNGYEAALTNNSKTDFFKHRSHHACVFSQSICISMTIFK